MAKNAVGSRDRSDDTRSRSPSGKKQRDKRRRSRSKSRRARDRSRSRGGKQSRSRSKSREKKHEKKDGRKRSRSRERGKKRSRSRKGNRSRSRRKKSGSRKRSASKAPEKKEKAAEKKCQRSPSRKAADKDKKDKEKAKEKEKDKEKEKVAEKNKPRSPSREDARGSPSVTRGSPRREDKGKEEKVSDKTSADVGKRGTEKSGSDRSDDEKPSKGGAPAADDAKDSEAPKEAKPPKPMELVTVCFGQRPFGMSPSKEAGAEGYVVAKVADGRPADERGVQVGWRLVAVGKEKCKDQSLDAIQALLKNAPLPVDASFEKPPSDDSPSNAEEDEDKDDEEQELDILDVRADQRRAAGTAMENIDELPVTREPKDLPNPITSWQDAVGRGMLNKALMEKLQTAGLKRPTLIQRHAVPVVYHEAGRYDLIAMAQTGSGKTFAFVIPTVSRLVLQGAMPRPFFPGKSPGCPLLLVLSPTRELAMQTSKEIEVIAKGTSLTAVCIYGGESLKFQQQRIEKAQIDILCATPGRLIDLVDSGKVSLSFVQSVILDEADQMLEQSLEVMCAEILTGRDMPEPCSGRQTLLFSATMPQKIRELCPRILRQERIANLTIGHYGEDQGGSCASIKQILRWCPDEGAQRIQVLIEDLKTFWIRPGKKGRVVIFTNQRLQATYLANALMAAGISCVHLHGKLEQHVREEVFDKFRRGMSDVLVATNVASRGLDFPDISLVVQYNLPQNVDIYTHRIGRTGRVGQVGCALGYMGPKDRRLNEKLVEFLELNKQEIPDFLRPRMVDPRRRPPMRSGRSRSRGRR